MSHLLPLSRVARLVGQSRTTLQQMIKEGSLATFDGQIELDELLRVFPNVQWEEDGEYKRVEEIKAKAFGKRIMERVLPDKEVLAERLFELGKEFASAKSLLLHYDLIFSWLERKFDEIGEECGGLVGNRLEELRGGRCLVPGIRCAVLGYGTSLPSAPLRERMGFFAG